MLRGLASHVFFFSSRRRHTRCSRDWSSDVCSSDLAWTSPRKFKNKVFRIVPIKQGLLVRGYEWFDLLDPATGKSLWRAPVEIKNKIGRASWGGRGVISGVVGLLKKKKKK